MSQFLPVTKKDMEDRGWDQVDFVYVTGDAYVDHSSFGTAIISRLLESRGYKVGIIPQPDWRRKESIAVFGEPRLGFLVNVKITEDNKIRLDFHVIVAYGVNISTIADNLVNNVKYKVEAFTGMEIEKINIYVEGVRAID